MCCKKGFKLNEVDPDLLEVREGDIVNIQLIEKQNTVLESIQNKQTSSGGVRSFLQKNKLNNNNNNNNQQNNNANVKGQNLPAKNNLKQFSGVVSKPNQQESEQNCDFVVVDDEHNFRHMVTLNIPEKSSKLNSSGKKTEVSIPQLEHKQNTIKNQLPNVQSIPLQASSPPLLSPKLQVKNNTQSPRIKNGKMDT